jgi:hypothetical protein
MDNSSTAKAPRSVAPISGFSQRPLVSAERVELAAQRLREHLCCVPFYAKRAEKARLAGDEMAYWRSLQHLQLNILLPPKESSAPDATT